MELTIDEITTLVFQHSRLAMQARKMADEHDKLAQVYLEVGKRFNREQEEKESKMNIRKILSGVLPLILLLVLVGSLSVTRAQDVPEATEAVTVVATVNGNPVEATLEPVQPAAPVDQSNNLLSIVLDKLITVAAIIGLIVLAYKAGGLVPKETFDSALEKGFSAIQGITAITPTPIDDRLFEMFKPGLKQWLDDEFAKRSGSVVNINVPNVTSDKSAAADALFEAAKQMSSQG